MRENHPLGVAVMTSAQRKGGRTLLNRNAASNELAAQIIPNGSAETIHTSADVRRLTLRRQRQWQRKYIGKLDKKLLRRKAPRKAS
jgi:hypothetical protein